MSDPYLAGVVWRLANMSETQRREVEEETGRLVAGWSRGVRRVWGAMRHLRRYGNARAAG
jgi:hypothetical protein